MAMDKIQAFKTINNKVVFEKTIKARCFFIFRKNGLSSCVSRDCVSVISDVISLTPKSITNSLVILNRARLSYHFLTMFKKEIRSNW